MVMFSYEYGVDIDECYADLRTALDTASLQLPEDASTPVVIELNMSQSADMILNVRAEGELDLKKTLEDTLIPDMESITDVAQVDVSGGTQDYIRVLLREDMLKQYGLNMAAVANYLGAVDFTIPAGSVKQGNQDISVSAAMEFNTVQRLEQVPVITASGSVVHLSDIAEVSMAKEKPDTISKSDGRETISISIQKKQSASVVQVTQKIIKLIDSYMEKIRELTSALNIIPAISLHPPVVCGKDADSGCPDIHGGPVYLFRGFQGQPYCRQLYAGIHSGNPDPDEYDGIFHEYRNNGFPSNRHRYDCR